MTKRCVALLIVAFVWAGCDSGSTTVPTDVIDTSDSNSDVIAPFDTADLPEGSMCRPGASLCSGKNWLVCNSDGSNYDVTACEGECVDSTGCADVLCTPMTSRCTEDGKVIVCMPDGSGWTEAVDCEDGKVCIGGGCMNKSCIPGASQCVGNTLIKCEGDPAAWVETECGDKAKCFKGDCVECVTEDQCGLGLNCVSGHCQPIPLSILTADLPEGQIKIAYSAQMEATGGTPPYTWSVQSGALPAGIMMSNAGAISGTPTVTGTFEVTIAVLDNAGMTVQKPYSIVIHEEGLSIISKSPLTNAEEGTEYSFQFQALGGKAPYGWMLIEGELPAGLSLSSDGLLSGTPEAHGDFAFKVRAIDVDDPPSYDSREFTLTVKIAPLVIYGDQEINLFLTKAIILPIITTGLALPYNEQLKAKGGVKPYVWRESEMTSLLQMLIPKSGVPEGLTLSESGVLSGRVTNLDASVKLDLSMIGLNYVLEGFFFFATVTDAQSPADSDQAIFLIPTVPIDLGGLGL